MINGLDGQGFGEIVALAQKEAPCASDCTYFARGQITGWIKIGRSRQPGYRISQMQNDRNGEPSEALAIIKPGAMERIYHKAFAAYREEGEWFAPHPDILAEIERLQGEAA